MIRGCWIHYIRAVTRRWRRLKLSQTDSKWRTVLGMVWSVPLVPPAKIGNAFTVVEDAIVALAPAELEGQLPAKLGGSRSSLVRFLKTHAPGQLAQQAGLVNLQADPPEISADRNVDVWVYARRQHPLLLKKSEEDGCFHLEMSNMMVGPVLLPANTLKCVH
ncbi:hypothetical protein PV325_007194 [Microctonus aethiopoides]|nr:hypothetical protein PV325_007194 [Microctonus aethiopoides]